MRLQYCEILVKFPFRLNEDYDNHDNISIRRLFEEPHGLDN